MIKSSPLKYLRVIAQQLRRAILQRFFSELLKSKQITKPSTLLLPSSMCYNYALQRSRIESEARLRNFAIKHYLPYF